MTDNQDGRRVERLLEVLSQSVEIIVRLVQPLVAASKRRA